jgi:hypothetical protein
MIFNRIVSQIDGSGHELSCTLIEEAVDKRLKINMVAKWILRFKSTSLIQKSTPNTQFPCSHVSYRQKSSSFLPVADAGNWRQILSSTASIAKIHFVGFCISTKKKFSMAIWRKICHHLQLPMSKKETQNFHQWNFFVFASQRKCHWTFRHMLNYLCLLHNISFINTTLIKFLSIFLIFLGRFKKRKTEIPKSVHDIVIVERNFLQKRQQKYGISYIECIVHICTYFYSSLYTDPTILQRWFQCCWSGWLLKSWIDSKSSSRSPDCSWYSL